MTLKLDKPICFFDLETTGLNISKDRIVEISILKINPNQSEESKTWKINPEMPISAESTSVHGISDEDIKDAPTFKEIAPLVLEMIKGSDLGGYNSNRFDIPLLAEELIRVGFDFDLKKHKAVDVQTIYHKKEPRTLSAAYKYYCDEDLNNAHSAEADTRATYEILKAQVEKYDDVEGSISFLSEYSTQNKTFDLAGFIGSNNNNEAIFSFGKYKGQKVSEVFLKDLGYYSWLQNSDFPLYTKKVFTRIKLENAL